MRDRKLARNHAQGPPERHLTLANIDSVDMYYLSMPTIEDVGDGSQDVLLVRVRAGQWEGWGECEASPLVSIASLVAPMSHSACKPVLDSVLGQRLDSLEDIRRIGALVRANSYDQLQSAHTLSGIDIAMCDLLGKRYEVPTYTLLGFRTAGPKVPYASALFGRTPGDTYAEAQRLAGDGYRAVKFGWQGFGTGSIASDENQLAAAREGLGPDLDLLVDAAMAWGADPSAGIERIPILEKFGVLFLEEPFVPEASQAYQALKASSHNVKLAGGEGCTSPEMARSMMRHAELDFIQIDAGRIGGITAAKAVADDAVSQGCTFINHTFTSHLALSASLQPYAGYDQATLCEYPVAPRAVSWELTENHLERDVDGLIRLPEAPGLGMHIRPETIAKYLKPVEIRVDDRVLYKTPTDVSTGEIPV